MALSVLVLSLLGKEQKLLPQIKSVLQTESRIIYISL